MSTPNDSDRRLRPKAKLSSEPSAAAEARPPQRRWRNIGTIAICCSFLFSAAVIGWAFSVGLRDSRGRSPSRSADTKVKPQNVSLEYEASLTPEEYVEYARNLDRQLIDQARRRSTPRRDLPSEDDARKVWQHKMASKARLLEQMRKDVGKEGFVEGSLQWEFAKELEAAAEDAPPTR
jgi:hypothetical protein